MTRLLSLLLLTPLLALALHAAADTTQPRSDTSVTQNNNEGFVEAPVLNEQGADSLKYLTENRPLTKIEFNISLLVLIFGMVVVVLEVYLIRTDKIREENAFKFIVVTLVVIGTLFLIACGFNNNQIAPAIGLLGTICGYLLGNRNTA